MFSELPVAIVTSTRATFAHVLSARPDAPVVPDVERAPHLAPARAGLARVLHRTADRVAPARAATRAVPRRSSDRCVPTHT